MKRLILITLSASIIFIGFGLPFIFRDLIGFVLAIVFIIIGATLFWFFEGKTKHSLETNSALNKMLKAYGENLITQKKPD